jgi:hypothetical protein
MTSIDRRMLLTRGAIGSAALTLTGGAALASVGEDAEVIRLGNGCLGHIAEVPRLAKAKEGCLSKGVGRREAATALAGDGHLAKPLESRVARASVRLKSEGGESHIPTVGQDGEGG